MQAPPVLARHFAMTILVLFLFSCNRPSDNKAALVIIQMPNQSSSISSSYVSNILNVASSNKAVSSFSAADNENWLPLLPTGYVDQYNLNCFFVVVSGPELKGDVCLKNNSTAGSEEFGEIDGPAFLDSTLEVYVLPGNNRVFSVYGMHAPSKKDCKKLYDPEFKRNKLSKPYLVGKSAPISVFAEAENKIKISKNVFDSNAFLDSCTFKDSIISEPTVAKIPGVIDLSIDNDITGNSSKTDNCVPLKINIKDSTGTNDVASPYEFNFSLTKGASPTTVATYSNAFDCFKDVSGTNGVNSFSTYQKAETEVWVKGHPDFSTLAFSSATQASVGAGVQFSVYPRINYANILARRATVGIPAKIINNVCYPLTLGVMEAETIRTPAIDTFTSFIISASSDNTSGRQVSFFNANNCADPSNIGNTAATVSQGNTVYWSRNVYFKTSGYSLGEKINFSTQHTSLGLSYSDTQHTIKLHDASDLEVKKIKISGPKNLLSTYCSGPYRVQFTNSSGTVLKLPSDATIRFLYDKVITAADNTALESTQLYRKIDETSVICQAPEKIEPNTPISVSAADSTFEFYIETLAVNTSEPKSLARYITVIDDNPTNYIEDRLLLRIHDYTSFTTKPDVPAPAIRDFN